MIIKKTNEIKTQDKILSEILINNVKKKDKVISDIDLFDSLVDDHIKREKKIKELRNLVKSLLVKRKLIFNNRFKLFSSICYCFHEEMHLNKDRCLDIDSFCFQFRNFLVDPKYKWRFGIKDTLLFFAHKLNSLRLNKTQLIDNKWDKKHEEAMEKILWELYE